MALIFKIGYRLWNCFPEMIEHWKIGVDVFTFQIKAILEINWNHDCWRKVKSSEKKGQVRLFDTCLLISWFTFWDTFWSHPSDPSSCIIPYGDLISCGFFISFHKNTHAPRTLPPAQTVTERSLFVLWKKDPYDLSITGHTSIFEEPTKNSMIIQTEHMFFLNTCSTWRRCPFIVSASTYPRCYFSLHQACFVERSQCWSRAQKVSWKELVGSWPGVWLERAKKLNMMGVKVLVG